MASSAKESILNSCLTLDSEEPRETRNPADGPTVSGARSPAVCFSPHAPRRTGSGQQSRRAGGASSQTVASARLLPEDVFDPQHDLECHGQTVPLTHVGTYAISFNRTPTGLTRHVPSSRSSALVGAGALRPMGSSQARTPGPRKEDAERTEHPPRGKGRRLHPIPGSQAAIRPCDPRPCAKAKRAECSTLRGCALTSGAAWLATEQEPGWWRGRGDVDWGH